MTKQEIFFFKCLCRSCQCVFATGRREVLARAAPRFLNVSKYNTQNIFVEIFAEMQPLKFSKYLSETLVCKMHSSKIFQLLKNTKIKLGELNANKPTFNIACHR